MSALRRWWWLLLAALGVAELVRRARLPPPVARIAGPLRDQTGTDESGAVHSVQSADVIMPVDVLEGIWDPMHMERLARTYWRFLSRCTLGLVRVVYSEDRRTVVLLAPPFRLLRFRAPEYEMDGRRGIVRWRIEDGILVAPQGAHGDGYLEIDVQRRGHEPGDPPGTERLHLEVDVANFYPAISYRLSRWLYENTQSRIHVIVCEGFLRSLVRLDLAESKVGRFATRDEVPDPTRSALPSERAASRGRGEPRRAAPSPTASA